MPDWLLYTGSRPPHDGITRLPPPPPWRVFDGGPLLPSPSGGSGNAHQATTYRPSDDAVQQVNAALYLRRPLLVTGPPGTGKSTLAYAVAHELGLGPVLHWPITSRTTLRDGLYQYDPLTRLYAAGRDETPADEDIGRYIRLGALGTALLPYERPRVLLVDEIDKSDIDLPNDLLTIFEKGEYEIPELARRADPMADVMTADGPGAARVTVTAGTVRCHAFPLVVMTSNGEREFPPAFLRRCVTVELRQPSDEAELAAIVREHLGPLADHSDDLVRRFFERASSGTLATDQLLNAVYLCRHAATEDRRALADRIMPYLSEPIDDD
ncbi:dynein-related subfamily AAA family protein [Actinomadura pelletieri DSM 43383]|uniref:Dynein-related subfamily AAA family protein n=1 Tax=Actinomadura pelletieri DSM 43383 TaxID=1120940 RepID=A0A495QIE7_9ACTN|nr:MoxR family ATPase [Actinomadura pelletieri]RKS71940.1 dynein-related subfamily AAA family protein [Actinomadura pelletieri DSM 43383]